MRDHPLVKERSLRMGIGYDDALELVRSQASRDPACAAAVRHIDEADARARKDALALNADMAKRLGCDAKALVAALAADPALETWLIRRVNLTRAHDRPPDDDSHHENE